MAVSLSTHQRGFTLIEMSIVLVIIGLIVGGILKGQELIESSRQKNLISQIDRLKAGTQTFVDRYRSLPGDFNRTTLLEAGSAIGNGGNDNGVVGASKAAVANLITLDGNVITAENVQYFNQLIASGLGSVGSIVQSGATVSCFSGLCATASPMPSSAFPSSGLSISYGTHEGGTAGGLTATPKVGHWFILSRFTTGSLDTDDAVLSPGRAYQIDSKYDDGNATAGNIRSSYVGTGCGATGTDYTASGTALACHLLFSLE